MPPENDRGRNNDEREPLLRNQATDSGEGGDSRDLLSFEEGDGENPREWPKRKKMANVAVIAAMSILSPLASSMFTPGIKRIAEDLDTTSETVIGCTTGFVIMLGMGPLFLAPLSETFGRRRLYMVCFTIFALLQIPSALAPNIGTLIAMRTLAGFFGSVGIANGGGTISDMFVPKERASVFGWYLLGPLLGPTLGPLFGGIIVQRIGWRWIFWVLTIVCCLNTLAGFLFLKESYAPVLLSWRKKEKEAEEGVTNKYSYDGEDPRPLLQKLSHSLRRPLKIMVQPIVLTMSSYQALLFGTTYSIYTNMQSIYGDEYGFSTEQVGLLYLGPGLGFLSAVWFLVPRIDTVYNKLTARNDGKARPEYRLPLANIGAVFIPVSLFWFAWTVQYRTPWLASIASTFFYGIGQVMILNCTQNYYIDSFEKYAASAIAAGAVFRSLVGGVVPLFAPALFEKLGYGWGISLFGFLAVAIAPAPMIFFWYGQQVREEFWVAL
ncbi:MFS general substrate transporter [Hortaea werneckii]|nr:MFS general substrate transporter [Hortaea werneckii]KAI7244851.1 MFS general substrate transporter [Hortaea werneckii]KAI7336741.1 MFS general substrate transporter [Hortaea werneckii]KAI7403917.1 MFS general substrate transporter [Hortaea werneckii]KAI7485627.1 MFS general substrate transporter [Hortaea werneckii]